MKTTSPQRRLALAGIFSAVSFLSACSSGVKLDDLSTVKAGGSDSSNFASQPWNDPKSPLFQRSIYFDFDESPSFAANGRYILYATQVGGKKVLAAVSVDGYVKQILSIPGSDVRQPSWGPFMDQ